MCYYAFHFHHDILSAVYLLATLGLKGKKIIHVHNADEVVPVSGSLKQRVLRPVLRWLGNLLSDQVIGISNHTLDKFNRQVPGAITAADRVHYYGVVGDSWMQDVETEELRRTLSIPDDASVILFLARIDRAKQPLFALEVISRVLAQHDHIHAVFGTY